MPPPSPKPMTPTPQSTPSKSAPMNVQSLVIAFCVLIAIGLFALYVKVDTEGKQTRTAMQDLLLRDDLQAAEQRKARETSLAKETKPAEGDIAAVMLEGKNAINVSDQKVGNKVVIAMATLEKSGYVVIHNEVNDGPGAILAQSALLPAGENKNVPVTVKVEDEVYYWAMIHVDDGDGVYNSADDAPVKDSKGNPVSMRFEGTTQP